MSGKIPNKLKDWQHSYQNRLRVRHCGGGEDFRRVLATIANQKGFRRVETIVVDSGSTDKTVELAEQFGSKVIKILPEEFSHSYARNLGASYASGEYLLDTTQR
jgi:glycosyltransferase involved in cell wall biosynthesis